VAGESSRRFGAIAGAPEVDKSGKDAR
jgi:hypothetical protein